MQILNDARQLIARLPGPHGSEAYTITANAQRLIEKLAEPEVKFEYFVQEAVSREELRGYIERHALAGFRPVGGVAVSCVMGHGTLFFQAMSREREL